MEILRLMITLMIPKECKSLVIKVKRKREHQALMLGRYKDFGRSVVAATAIWCKNTLVKWKKSFWE